tara:strand:- start:104 stop:298 length:195 start_codon:yes stop_codon:yes gene_type:complete
VKILLQEIKLMLMILVIYQNKPVQPVQEKLLAEALKKKNTKNLLLKEEVSLVAFQVNQNLRLSK